MGESELGKISKVLADSTAFGGLPGEIAARLAAIASWREFGDGEVIVRAGEEGDSLFIIAEGKALVEVETMADQAAVATVGPGDYLGEVAVIWRQRRSATVGCMGSLAAVELAGEPLRELLDEVPEIRDHLAEVGIKRIEENMDTYLGE